MDFSPEPGIGTVPVFATAADDALLLENAQQRGDRRVGQAAARRQVVHHLPHRRPLQAPEDLHDLQLGLRQQPRFRFLRSFHHAATITKALVIVNCILSCSNGPAAHWYTKLCCDYWLRRPSSS